MSINKFLLCALVLTAGFGCSGSGDSKKVLAVVNGSVITVKDFKDDVNGRPAQVKEYAMTEQGKAQILNDIVTRKLVLVEAEKRGIPKDPKILQSVAQEKEQMKTQIQEQIKAYKDALKKMDQDVRDRVIIRELARQEVENKIKVSDSEARVYMAAHRSEFRRQDGTVMGNQEALEAAQNRVRQEKQQKRLSEWLTELQKNAKMETHPELLKDIKF